MTRHHHQHLVRRRQGRLPGRQPLRPPHTLTSQAGHHPLRLSSSHQRNASTRSFPPNLTWWSWRGGASCRSSPRPPSRWTTAPFMPGTEDYTLERFVVGSSIPINLTYAAAPGCGRRKPRPAPNPSSSTGIRSGQRPTALRHRPPDPSEPPGLPGHLPEGDTFTNELVQAIREGRNEGIRRNTAPPTSSSGRCSSSPDGSLPREEMFHTFNTLYEAGRRIVLPQTVPARCCAWTTGCAPGSNGACLWTSSPDYETGGHHQTKAIRRGMNPLEPVLQLYRGQHHLQCTPGSRGTVNKILAFQELMGSVDVDTGHPAPSGTCARTRPIFPLSRCHHRRGV